MYDFGLTDEQFWDLTPAKFNALSRQFDAATERTDHDIARVCWAVIAATGAKKEGNRPFTVKDFLVRSAVDDEPKDPNQQVKSVMATLFGIPAHMEWMNRG